MKDEQTTIEQQKVATSSLLLFALITALPTSAAATLAMEGDSVLFAQLERSLNQAASGHYEIAWQNTQRATKGAFSIPIASADSDGGDDSDGGGSDCVAVIPDCCTPDCAAGGVSFTGPTGWTNNPNASVTVTDCDCNCQ